MAFHDFRDPIEYVVNQYFERKRAAESNKTDNIESKSCGQKFHNEESLPDSPCLILYNKDGDAYKFIYGGYEVLQTDPFADVFLWQQEIIYNENGDAVAFVTTYPDGLEVKEILIEEDGKLKGIGVE